MHYVYFLELNNKNIYVGQTNDVFKRLKKNNSGYVISTKAFRPIKLKSYIAVESSEHAVKLE